VSAAAPTPEGGLADFQVTAGSDRDDRLLVARFPAPMQVASWAIWNGGRCRVPAVAWVGVTNAELPVDVDPRELCERRLRAAGLEAAVGLLTSGQLARHRQARADAHGVAARALATVGLSNALRVGDSPGPLAGVQVGTINLLCAVSVPLTEAAALEAASIAVEARTAAVLEARHPSRRSAAPATGTGTDCVVLAWPDTIYGTPKGFRTSRDGAPAGNPPAPHAIAAGQAPAVFAGKHTALGHVIGRAVGDCVRAGVADWLEAQACR
jgi:adenosylcobinamide amidohydrolase